VVNNEIYAVTTLPMRISTRLITPSMGERTWV
jgi:hypothetical protein